jgi:hypothetical protein
VIGVCTPGGIPPGNFDGAFGVVDHLLRAATCAGILTYRLLRKDRDELRAAHGGDVAWRSQTEAVAETEGGR